MFLSISPPPPQKNRLNICHQNFTTFFTPKFEVRKKNLTAATRPTRPTACCYYYYYYYFFFLSSFLLRILLLSLLPLPFFFYICCSSSSCWSWRQKLCYSCCFWHLNDSAATIVASTTPTPSRCRCCNLQLMLLLPLWVVLLAIGSTKVVSQMRHIHQSASHIDNLFVGSGIFTAIVRCTTFPPMHISPGVDEIWYA